MRRALFSLLALVLFAGCSAGPTGPKGDTGASGPGTKTVYNFYAITNSAQGYQDFSCPTVSLNSSVTCYIQVSYANVNISVPCGYRENDGSTTYINTSVSAGSVRLLWTNTGTTCPNITRFIVAVVN